MSGAERREARVAVARLLTALGPHELTCTVYTEPSGARRLELRRLVDGRPLLARAPYSVPLLAAILAEGVEVAYRTTARLPAWEAP
jgi:hypothetical protein